MHIEWVGEREQEWEWQRAYKLTEKDKQTEKDGSKMKRRNEEGKSVRKKKERIKEMKKERRQKIRMLEKEKDREGGRENVS